MASGAYGLTPFLVAKLAIGMPLEVLLVSVTGSVLYLLVGLQLVPSKFGAYLVLSVLSALSAQNFGNLLGLCLPNLNAALPALCVGATLLLAFAGFIGERLTAHLSWWHSACWQHCCQCRQLVVLERLTLSALIE